jgi:chorismate dehydratase
MASMTQPEYSQSVPRAGTVRVGAVSYLNTKPLVHFLPDLAPEIELTFDLPSRLADALAAGDLDVALIPSIEALQQPGYRVLSNACIGCRGPVFSVKLFSRKPADRIRTLALDEGSRTSVALTRILLAERFGIRPELRNLPLGQGTADTPADAILLIGDRAMHGPAEQFEFVWDLGDQWCRWSELPFVFAMWTARPGFEDLELAAALEASRDRGLRELSSIAAAEGPPLGLSTDVCLRYFRDHLYFYLGDREQQALRLFQKHAISLGMAPADVSVAQLLSLVCPSAVADSR